MTWRTDKTKPVRSHEELEGMVGEAVTVVPEDSGGRLLEKPYHGKLIFRDGDQFTFISQSQGNQQNTVVVLVESKRKIDYCSAGYANLEKPEVSFVAKGTDNHDDYVRQLKEKNLWSGD